MVNNGFTDSAPSLEPQGLQNLIRDLNAIHQAMKNKPDNPTDKEWEQRNKLRNY